MVACATGVVIQAVGLGQAHSLLLDKLFADEDFKKVVAGN